MRVHADGPKPRPPATLQAVFQAAVYVYAREGQAPQGFASEPLLDSMTRG